MPIEAELKARVRDPGTLSARLLRRGEAEQYTDAVAAQRAN
ncbi:hypothetical protein GCM10011581_13800 [Saccharopolyspora subtropica]|uniref:Uncharacterized protein n=1 Tax=Saccharopolyspora thermophila TaxID=89367 RepID=A0A917JQQ6_9PSEU|nr:hypothetical protein [Saccharopolyspora subtropica]GGI77926.1 hypothetical protein GCM10011581_13800 [Saccharopolyspora subtropica]